jgi:hypothetical protein
VADHPELVEVELGVARLQRIEGPGDQIQALGQHMLSLRQLELIADAVVAIVGMDAGHVRAVLELAGRGEPQEAKDKAGQPLAVERAQQQPAMPRRGDQHVQRDNIDLWHAPRVALELLDREELVMGGEGTNGDGHGDEGMKGMRVFRGGPAPEAAAPGRRAGGIRPAGPILTPARPTPGRYAAPQREGARGVAGLGQDQAPPFFASARKSIATLRPPSNSGRVAVDPESADRVGGCRRIEIEATRPTYSTPLENVDAHTRNPTLSFLLFGLFLLRAAQRRLFSLLANDPPRNTRRL